MKQTLAGQVRAAAQKLGAEGRIFTAAEVAAACDMVCNAEKRPLYRALRDFAQAGELERVPGCARASYIYKGRSRAPELQEVMWRLLRARRRVAAADMQELAGAGEAYVRQWLRMLERRGIVKKIADGRSRSDGASIWQMVADPVVLPRDDQRADTQRRRRAEKKKAIAALDRAWAAIVEARMAINTMPEEGE